MSGILYEGEPDVRVQQLAAHLVDLRLGYDLSTYGLDGRGDGNAARRV